MKINNIFENLTYSINKEIVKDIYNSENVEIKTIASQAQTTDWLSDERSEVAILLEGEATIEFLDYDIKLKKGDTIYIAPQIMHRVINQSPKGLWLGIYFNQ